MSDQFVEAFVEKLILLEQKTGSNVQYRVMPPLTTAFHDHLSIQRTAKDIADFVGVTGYTFIVAVAKQEEKVAGHIDLATEGSNVFVEIDEDIMKFPDAVAATLCHEVCHKWLQMNRIALPVEMENEILTDITSVFLGFGKIMLNGCKTTHVRYESIENGTRTITETKTSGYLDRNQFAFVYRLVCAMRNVPETEAMQGLNPEASQALQACDASFGHHYDTRFHMAETTHDSVKEFNAVVTNLQHALADMNKHALYTRESYLKTIDSFLGASHKELSSLRQKAAEMKENREHDPVLNFLRSIQKHCELRRMSNRIETMREESDGFLRHTRSVCRHFSRNTDRFPTPTPDAFTIVTCPHDGTKLRLPENSGDLVATCPSCKYQFAYNTEVPTFPEPNAATPAKSTFKTKLLKLFGRKKIG